MRATMLDPEPLQRLLLDAVDDAVIVTDVEGRVVYWNRRAGALLGNLADEARGRPLAELLPVAVAASRVARREPLADGTGRLVGEALVLRAAGEGPDRLELYRHVFEAANDAIAIVDAQGRYLEQNPAHRALLGYADEDLRDRTPAIHLGEDGFARVRADLERDGACRGEFATRTRDGRDLVIELVAFTMRDSTGRVFCHVGVKRDVTERRATEARLREHVERLRALQELADRSARARNPGEAAEAALDAVLALLHTDRAAVLLFDGDGVMRFRAWRGLSDAYRRAVEGHTPWSPEAADAEPIAIADVEADPSLAAYGDVFRREGIRALAFVPLVHGDRLVGKFMVYRREPHVFTDEELGLGRTVAGTVAFTLARTQAEHDLRSSEERFRTLCEGSPLGIFLADPHGACVYTNPMLQKMYGLDAESARGDGWARIVHPEDRERVQAEWQEAVRARRPFEVELRWQLEDGGVRWAQARASPLGDGSGYVGVVEDVTERRTAAAALEAARRQVAVSEKLSALGTLVSGVAHEIRTPLTYVANNIYLVHARLERAARERPELADLVREVEGYHAAAQEGVERINHLVRGLRRFTQHRAGGRADVDLAVVVRGAVDLFRATNRGRVRLEADLRGTGTVAADPTALQQVVLNLLDNAADASVSGGLVRIATEEAPGEALVVVEDTGTGVPPEVAARMFDPLFTTKADGTGLGLSIVRRIVDEHGGRIEFATAAGRGTRFTVRLPAAQR